MRLVFLGPPGAGKGTQARVAALSLGVPQISTGEIFRAAIAAGTLMGTLAKKHIDAGGLVPDEVTVGIVRDRLVQPDCQKGYILDGFPRTLPQAEALDLLLTELGTTLDGVVNFAVPDEGVVARLAGRRVCRTCGETYHLRFNPSPKGSACGACGGELYQRSDDSEAAIRQRLVTYNQQTEPLIGYFRASGRLRDVDADAAIEQVQQSLREVLAELAARRA